MNKADDWELCVVGLAGLLSQRRSVRARGRGRRVGVPADDPLRQIGFHRRLFHHRPQRSRWSQSCHFSSSLRSWSVLIIHTISCFSRCRLIHTCSICYRYFYPSTIFNPVMLKASINDDNVLKSFGNFITIGLKMCMIIKCRNLW